MSQTEQILKELKKGRKLTQLDALAEFGCFRLGARILEIKQMGYKVISEMVSSDNGKHFARYELMK